MELVVATVASRIDPLADRIAHIGRLLILEILRPVAPVGIDAAGRVDHELEQDERGARREHELVREHATHHPWHPDWDALVGRVVALSAGLLILEARLKARLVL